MANPEGYQPSPGEVRKAESSMDDRQKELTETREDALFEGGKREKENSEKTETVNWAHEIAFNIHPGEGWEELVEDIVRKAMEESEITNAEIDQSMAGEIRDMAQTEISRAVQYHETTTYVEIKLTPLVVDILRVKRAQRHIS